MNDILKQRLVGALILLALGVVFWPIVFVQPDPRQDTEQAAMPPPPTIVTEPVAVPDTSGIRTSPIPDIATTSREDEATDAAGQQAASVASGEHDATANSSVAAAPASVEHPTRDEPPPTLKMDSTGVPVAWTLQVATVSAAEKADELRKQLIAMNQKAYIAKVTSGGKTLYRVCIGPKFERVELEKLQAGINARFGVNTMVVRYVP